MKFKEPIQLDNVMDQLVSNLEVAGYTKLEIYNEIVRYTCEARAAVERELHKKYT